MVPACSVPWRRRREELLGQDLSSLLGQSGEKLGYVEKGSRERGKEEGRVEKRNEERRPMAEDMSQRGNDKSTWSTANVVNILKEDRMEGRVCMEKAQPLLSLKCGLCTQHCTETAIPGGQSLPCARTIGTFRCCHSLSTRSRWQTSPGCEPLFFLSLVSLAA